MKKKQNQQIRMLLGGDTRELDKIYQNYLPNVIKFTTTCGGSREEGLDIFKTALLAIYQNARQESFELHCSFSVHLNTICYKIWSNRHPEIDIAYFYPASFSPRLEDNFNANDLIMDEAAGNLFRLVFDTLSKEERSIVELYFTGKSTKEIQQIFDHPSLQHTSKRLQQCMKKLIHKVKIDCRIHQAIYWSVLSKLKRQERKIILLSFGNNSTKEIQHSMALPSPSATQNAIRKAERNFAYIVKQDTQQYKYFFWKSYLQLEEKEKRLLALHYAKKSFPAINELMGYPSVKTTKDRIIQCKKNLVTLILSQ